VTSRAFCKVMRTLCVLPVTSRNVPVTSRQPPVTSPLAQPLARDQLSMYGQGGGGGAPRGEGGGGVLRGVRPEGTSYVGYVLYRGHRLQAAGHRLTGCRLQAMGYSPQAARYIHYGLLATGYYM
jgi:hypothetical protein